MPDSIATTLSTENIVNEVLKSIDREREREIISRRFGLFERKETLEQIGELLGITRERVRQLEKAVMQKLRTTAENKSLPQIEEFEKKVLEQIEKTGQVIRVSELTMFSVDNVVAIESGIYVPKLSSIV